MPIILLNLIFFVLYIKIYLLILDMPILKHKIRRYILILPCFNLNITLRFFIVLSNYIIIQLRHSFGTSLVLCPKDI